MTRYDFAPLARAVGAHSRSQAAVIFGPSSREVARWRCAGLSADLAEELACRAGLHPLNVWPAWRAPRTRRRPVRLRAPIVALCPGSGIAAPAEGRRTVCPDCGSLAPVNPTRATLRRHGRRAA